MVSVIAECCQNHNGDMTLLKEMVHAAAEAGATYCKIQSIQADELTRREECEAARPYQAEYDRLKKLDLKFQLNLKI